MMTFNEFFARAEERGLDLHEVAAGLLANVCLPAAAGQVFGLRQTSYYNIPSRAEQMEQHKAEKRRHELLRQVEDLSRITAHTYPSLAAELESLQPALNPFEGYRKTRLDPRLRPVPVSVWEGLGSVGNDLLSHWPDDEDDDCGVYTVVEWLAGRVTTVDWYDGADPNIVYEKTEYSALQLDEALGISVLADPSSRLQQVSSHLRKHTPEERRQWIEQRGRSPGGADVAHAEYKLHPQFDGTKQPEFRRECNEIWGKIIGTPKRVKKVVHSS